MVMEPHIRLKHLLMVSLVQSSLQRHRCTGLRGQRPHLLLVLRRILCTLRIPFTVPIPFSLPILFSPPIRFIRRRRHHCQQKHLLFRSPCPLRCLFSWTMLRLSLGGLSLTTMKWRLHLSHPATTQSQDKSSVRRSSCMRTKSIVSCWLIPVEMDSAAIPARLVHSVWKVLEATQSWCRATVNLVDSVCSMSFLRRKCSHQWPHRPPQAPPQPPRALLVLLVVVMVLPVPPWKAPMPAEITQPQQRQRQRHEARLRAVSKTTARRPVSVP
mmetsp:Transcript_18056/g.30779  ORF Transcript_18056/g.30779 Transcript_18056/m.30779 type:complete len:270 (+) Transcript_18056:833-1642(+)